MQRSTFEIARMDCAADEGLVRMKLGGVGSVRSIDVDLALRRVTVLHEGGSDPVATALRQLDLGTRLLTTDVSDDAESTENSVQRRLLWTVLAINASLFVAEAAFGLLSGSMGLVADSLDMLADALVYGLSLLAVGAALARQRSVARVSGYLQLSLAILGLVEVVRRVVALDRAPDVGTMIVVSLLALLANGASLMLLQRSRSRDVHIRASMIFTSNDVVINLGVIVAAVLVGWTRSGLPDLIVGAAVFLVVLRGALRILKLAE
jgi:Co/Zn/Cd efflux system component